MRRRASPRASGRAAEPGARSPAAPADGLAEYRARRRFALTPEPRGERPRAGRRKRLAFVIHKHRAGRLHYDLRLEWAGVLRSWAVPRGPSLDPGVKRLAVEVEDHPLDYRDFEGVIPAGEYGGGTVMVWDRGTWTPEVPDVGRALLDGDLKFALHGEKLRGSWVLVRTRGAPGRDAARSWLLIKHRDDGASARKRDDPTVARPRSVLSGRLLAEIAADEGGDVRSAATGDPEKEVRALLRRLEAAPGRARARR